jgi:hypothetical protein
MAMNGKNSIVSVVDGPKRKPFPTKQNVVGSDAGEWCFKGVENRRLFQAVSGFSGMHTIGQVDLGGSVYDAPKRKPFPSKKQTVNTDAGEWIVKEVDGKRLFQAVSGFCK